MNDFVTCTYLIETPLAIETALKALIDEQTSGTFTSIPGKVALEADFRGQVVSITELDSVSAPRLPGARPSAQYQRAQVKIAIPLSIAYDIFTLVTAAAGNVFELNVLSGLRLLEIDVPPAFAEQYPRPQFSIDGCRRLTDVYKRPMIGTIIKPSVGLTPETTANMVQELASAGIDFIKDDELMTSPPYSSLSQRVNAIMPVINDHAQKTGKQVMYAFNVSHDDVDTMLRHHDIVLEAGGTGIMVSINPMGMAAVLKLRQHSQLPIHAHRNGWGMQTRCDMLGWDYRAYQMIWRLIGVDQLHVNGIQNKFWESDDSVVRSITACHTPLLDDSDRLLPVVSSGQWGGQAPEQFRRTNSVDVLYQAGGGIMGHPGGMAGGVRAIQEAWEAAVQGIPLADYAQTHSALAQALEKFGELNISG